MMRGLAWADCIMAVPPARGPVRRAGSCAPLPWSASQRKDSPPVFRHQATTEHRMARMTQRRKIHRFHLDGSETEYPVRFKEDVLAAEEPLEIRIGGRSFAVTMRTPGDDFDLVAGFLVSEGIISCQSELISLRFCAGEAEGRQTYQRGRSPASAGCRHA